MDWLTGLKNKRNRSTKKEIPLTLGWYFAQLTETLNKLETNTGRMFYDFQKKWLYDPAKFKSCGKSRQIGLTMTSASEAVFKGFLLGLDTLYTSKASRQYLRAKRYAKADLKLLNKIDPRIEIVKDSDGEGELGFTTIDPNDNVRPDHTSIYFLPSNDISNIEGFPGRVLIDELSNIKEAQELYNSLIPSLGSNPLYDFGCQFRARGTNNLAYRIHTNKDNRFPDFSRHLITIDDAIADGFPFDKKTIFANLSKEAILEHYYVEFIESGYTPFTDDLVKACERNERDIRSNEIAGACYGGWDFAHEVNSSIFTIFEKRRKDGKKVQRHTEDMTRQTNPLQEDKAHDLIRRFALQGLAIEYTGAGIPICQNLEKYYGKLIKRFVTTNANQTEVAENLKYELEDDNMRLVADEDQRKSITSVKRLITPSGNVKYEGKNKSEHGDYFRAICLANWAADEPVLLDIDYTTAGEKRAFSNVRLVKGGAYYGY